MMYRGPGFLAPCDSAPHPPPSPFLFRQQVVSLSQIFLCVAGRACGRRERGREGVGVKPAQTIARQNSPLNIQYSLAIDKIVHKDWRSSLPCVRLVVLVFSVQLTEGGGVARPPPFLGSAPTTRVTPLPPLSLQSRKLKTRYGARNRLQEPSLALSSQAT
jgi:hypothetical protein